MSYQFPGEIDDVWDDWLQVEFAADLSPQVRVKRTSAPAFLTWELASLVGACRALPSSGLPLRVLHGIEPNLAIDALGFGEGEWTLCIGVALSFAPYLWEPFDEPFEARVNVLDDALTAFVDALERELEPFPKR